MKPLFQPRLVNGPFQDPVLYLDFLFEKRALLFDLGDIRALPTRKILRVTDVFISHTHMDHFADFDWLLRICLGREKRLRLFGPPGFIDRVEHKLGAYTWNLVDNYETDLVLAVTELHPGDEGRQAVFRCRRTFAREEEAVGRLPGGILIDEPGWQVRGALLDHGTPCLGFAAVEKQHVNIWKNRLEALGLPVGPWLRQLKQAVLAELPADTPIRVWRRQGGTMQERQLLLGELTTAVVRIAPGQKISYIVDVGFRSNADKIKTLIQNSTMLFIEAAFLEEEAAMAAQKYHLTARQAGQLAREAGVKQLMPIHFSPRYSDREQALRAEALAAFAGIG